MAGASVLDALDRAGAILRNKHCVYKNGEHGPDYVDMDRVFPDIALMKCFCAHMLEPFDLRAEVIVGPAAGGMMLAALMASMANSRDPVLEPVVCVWADKDGDDFVIDRAGFADRLCGKRTLIVEDRIRTGKTVIQVREEAQNHGALIVGVSAICGQSGVTAQQLGIPRLEILACVDVEAMPAKDCELCQLGIPIVANVGHGAKFCAANPNYRGGYTRA